MSTLVKLVQSPFNSNLEAVGNLILKLHVPYSDKSVTVQVNPNIQDHQDAPSSNIRQVMLTKPTSQTKTLSFDFNENIEHKVEIDNESYSIKLMAISSEPMQGQDFPSFEFEVKNC